MTAPAWFLLILAFLVVSTSPCLTRNAPRMIKDMRSWKDHVREHSLRAFHHRAEFDAGRPRADAVTRLTALLANRGYRIKTVVPMTGATLLAAKAGAANKLGHILAHTAIVVICIGGLLDGDMLIRAQMWFWRQESDYRQRRDQRDIPLQQRFASVNNPGFRGNAFDARGATVSHCHPEYLGRCAGAGPAVQYHAEEIVPSSITQTGIP
ncbi:cytochrome c biogenesis protein ResB [Cupriavidus basilensis]